MTLLFTTSNAPEPIWPYSKVYEANWFLFCSGQLWLKPKTRELIDQTIENQTKQACENIKSVLNVRKLKLNQVVKVTVFLKNISDIEIMNSIYQEYFSHFPARTCVAVADLPLNALIEIEVIVNLKK